MNTKAVGEKVMFPELSYQITNVLFEVHNNLGPGFTENIYQEATVWELEGRKIPYEKQEQIEVFYKGKFIGTYRLDLVIDGKIILELKAVAALNDVYKAQVLSYLKATGLHLGILVNFGGTRVEQVRVLN